MIANDKKVWIKILDLVTKLATNDPGLMRLKTMLPKVQNCDTYLTYWNIIKTKSIQKSLPAIEAPYETITETTAAESDIEVIQTGEEEQEENATVSIQEMSDLSDALSPEAIAQTAALRALYAQSAKKRSSTALSSSEQLSPPSFYVPPKKRFIEVTRNSPNKRVTRQNLQENTQHTGITPFTHEILMTEADKSFTRNLFGPGSAAENLAPAPVEPTILEEVDEDIQVVSEFVNKRGTDQFPFLVAILLNGNNPRFCVNIDGYLRSCRPCHINMSKMELLIFCTRGREGMQCRGKHKLRVKHKEMVLKEKDFSKRYPRNKLRLNIERPDLIYDTKNYEVVSYELSSPLTLTLGHSLLCSPTYMRASDLFQGNYSLFSLIKVFRASKL